MSFPNFSANFGARAAAGGGPGGGVTDHQELTGRAAANAHAQYLLIDGTRKMTGDLDLDGHSLLNALGLATDAELAAAVAGLAAESYVDAAVAGLASTAYVDAAVLGLASEAYVDAAIAGLASDAELAAVDATLLRLDGTRAMTANLNLGGFTLTNHVLDHGTLAGIADDDHTIYLLASGARAFSGDLVPSADNARSIGANNLRLVRLYLVNGSATAPSVSFHGSAGDSSNYGLLRVGNELAISIGGTQRFTFGGTGIYDNFASGTLSVGTGSRPWNGAFFKAAIQFTAAALFQTTVGAAGGASALPATPTKYLIVKDDSGTELVVPCYAKT